MSRAHDNHYSEATGGKDPEIPLENPDRPSTNLKWVPRIVRRWWRIRGKVRTFWKAVHPKLTDDELEAREYIKAEEIKDRTCRADGRRYGKIVAKKLAQLAGQDPYQTKHVELVKWKDIQRDESFSKIVLVMNTRPKDLPSYILFSDLTRAPAYTEDLAAAISLPVKWSVGVEGVTLTITRNEEKPERKRIKAEDLLENEDPDESTWV